MIQDEENSVKGNCIARVQKILLNSTEKQAVFITHIMEAVAEQIDTAIQ